MFVKLDTLIRLGQRAPAFLWPTLLGLLLACGFLLAAQFGGDRIRDLLPARQVIGTSIMFVLMPAYLLAMAMLQYRRTCWLLDELRPIAPAARIAEVRERLNRLPGTALPAGVVGALFGLGQNDYVLDFMSERGAVPPFDLAFVLGNCLLWTSAMLILAWRLPVSRSVSRLGASLPVNVHDLSPLQPLGRLATVDVLVIAGAVALMPLQSLDAQFRTENYLAGIILALGAAVACFLLPLLGVHRQIMNAKGARLATLQAEIAGADQSDTVQLESLLSHRDRIVSVPNWPLNTRLITRFVAYVVIAPLAWVAAALVENLVDRF